MRSALLTIAGVVVLSALVAVASHGTSVWVPPRPGGADAGEVLPTVAVVFGLGLVVAGAATLALHRAFLARRSGAPPLRSVLVRAFPSTVAALALVSLLAVAGMDMAPVAGDRPGVARLDGGRQGDAVNIVGWFDSPVKAGEAEAEPENTGTGGGSPARLPPLSILAGAVAIALALAGVAWWRAGRSRDHMPEKAGQDAAHEAVLRTIDAMLADPDPATAIIGAYALLLEELAAAGGRRRDHEGPMEHLRRVLTILNVRPEPIRQLIELFEVARFSTHPLRAAHREQALEALHEVADDLAPGAGAVRGRPAAPSLGSAP